MGNRRFFSSNSNKRKSLNIYKKIPVHKTQMDQVIKREFEDENCDMETDFDFQNTNAKKIKTKVQVIILIVLI